MPRASVSAAEWIDEHEQYYSVLFDDGVVKNKLEAQTLQQKNIALTALKRFSPVTNKKSINHHRVKSGVTIVLEACFDNKLGPKNAILDQTEPARLPAINHATATTIDHWERSCFYWSYPSPFFGLLHNFQPDTKLDTTNLILMTVAALLYVNPSIARGSRSAPLWTINGVQYYGPRFTEHFLQGRPLPGAPLDEFATHPNLDITSKEQALARHPTNLHLALRDLVMGQATPYPDLDSLYDE